MFGCILVPYLNKKINFIAKKQHLEGTQSTWHRFWRKYIGYIPIDRSKGQEALIKAGSYLKKGSIIIIYPEGTRSLDGKVGKFKKGGVILALSMGISIVPISISGSALLAPKGEYMIKSGKIKMMIGKPISTEGKDISDRQYLVTAIRDEVIKNMAEEDAI